jgi:hypothetical protein
VTSLPGSRGSQTSDFPTKAADESNPATHTDKKDGPVESEFGIEIAVIELEVPIWWAATAGPGSRGLAYPGVLDQRSRSPKRPKAAGREQNPLSIVTDHAAVERWEAAYDAEAGYPTALKGFSRMLYQVTTLRRETLILIVRVREPEVRTPLPSSGPSHRFAKGERPSPKSKEVVHVSCSAST